MAVAGAQSALVRIVATSPLEACIYKYICSISEMRYGFLASLILEDEMIDVGLQRKNRKNYELDHEMINVELQKSHRSTRVRTMFHSSKINFRFRYFLS